jgi:hypothetical protein
MIPNKLRKTFVERKRMKNRRWTFTIKLFTAVMCVSLEPIPP